MRDADPSLFGAGVLYRLDFASGKSYVGVSRAGRLAARVAEHRYRVKSGGQWAVHNAWRAHGEPAVVVLAYLPLEGLSAAEVRAVLVFGTLAPGGYNLSPGGERSPMLDPQVAARVRAKRVGWVPSAATRARMAAGQAGKKHSAATKAKMSATRKRMLAEGLVRIVTVPHTPERIAKTVATARRNRALKPK